MEEASGGRRGTRGCRRRGGPIGKRRIHLPEKGAGGIDARIRYLQKRLPNLTIVDRHATPGQVFFGATVKLENSAGDRKTYRIVGADEADASTGDISVDSPVAQTLLKRSRGDRVTVADREWQIVAIDYPTDP